MRSICRYRLGEFHRPSPGTRRAVGLAWFGQPADQVGANYPNAAWREKEWPRGVFLADNISEIAGLPFNAEVMTREGLVSFVQLSHEARVENAAECQARSLAVAAALEQQLGLLYWNYEIIDGGRLVRTPAGSTIMVNAWRRPNGGPLPLNRLTDSRIDGFAVRGRIEATSGDQRLDVWLLTDLWQRDCEIHVDYRRFEE